MNLEAANALLQESDLIATREDVAAGLDKLARALTNKVGDKLPTFLTVMRGGMVPAAWLLQRLDFPLRVDFVHATRYHSGTEAGVLEFVVKPGFPVAGETIILFDDIFDEGYTFEAIREYCLAQGAAEVITTALVLKEHDRGLDRDMLDLWGLKVPDVYIFGCGMDINEYWRQLDEIRAKRD